MKTLVLYDSMYGNTERIAKAMTKALEEFGPATALRVDHAQLNDMGGVGLLMIGCPTQAWQLTPATRTFIELILDDVPAQFAVSNSQFESPVGNGCPEYPKLRTQSLE